MRSLLFFLYFPIGLFADWIPVTTIDNPSPDYTLINSVDFDRTQNRFCVTFSQADKVILYDINAMGELRRVQTLKNPLARLSCPQHAIFTPDGTKLIVANWSDQTINLYQKKKDGLFDTCPKTITSPPECLERYKPHGIAMHPAGKMLAIAFGAGDEFGKAIGLFTLSNENHQFSLTSLFDEASGCLGMPKGITFTPDGSHLFVTFCDQNSLVVFAIDEATQRIVPTPKQILSGYETKIFRPEDVKFAPDASCIAISNSEEHRVTFYPFDKSTNRITQMQPSAILQNPDAGFVFPHGLAFQQDGSFLAITQFGPIQVTDLGSIIWDDQVQPEHAKITIYKQI